MRKKISEKTVQVTVCLPENIANLVEKYCKITNVSFSGFCRESTIRRLESLSIISEAMNRHIDTVSEE